MAAENVVSPQLFTDVLGRHDQLKEYHLVRKLGAHALQAVRDLVQLKAAYGDPEAADYEPSLLANFDKLDTQSDLLDPSAEEDEYYLALSEFGLASTKAFGLIGGFQYSTFDVDEKAGIYYFSLRKAGLPSDTIVIQATLDEQKDKDTVALKLLQYRFSGNDNITTITAPTLHEADEAGRVPAAQIMAEAIRRLDVVNDWLERRHLDY